MEKRKNNKLWILWMLSVILVFGWGGSARAQGQTKTCPITDVSLFVCSNGVITGFTGGNQVTEVVIPRQIGGQSVTGIGANAFYNCGELTSVVMPDTVTSFGEKAFGECRKLNSILAYGENEVQDNQIVVERDDLSVVELPAGLTSVDTTTFLTCTSIRRFAVAAGNTAYKAIGQDGNTENKGEMLLNIDGTKLIRMAPAGINGTYSIPEGIKEIGDYALEGNQGGGRKYIIPTSVEKIGNYAFYGCGNLNGVEFMAGSKLTTVGAFAFAKNANLSTDPHPFTLPESVTNIGESCFKDCVNMEIDLSRTAITTIPQYIFDGCQNIHAVTMPASLRTLDAYAFYGCSNLNNIYFLGATLDKIGTAAFQGCPNLHEIIIPEGITSIEDNTFDGCMNLNKIILPQSVERIGENAFRNCQNIHEMVIPKNVKYIANSSFTGAKQDEIDVSQNEYAQAWIGGLPKQGATFVVGGVIYEVTNSAEQGGTVAATGTESKQVRNVVVEDTVMRGGYTFTVTEIAKNAFKRCKKLKKVTIGSNVRKIGAGAFAGDKKLNRVLVKAKGLKSVGKNAFKGIHKKAVMKVANRKAAKKCKKLLKGKTGWKPSMKVK